MSKNIYSLDDFKNQKSKINSTINSTINESVEAIDQSYRVSFDIDIPKALIASYIKKVKETAGKDLRQKWGEERLAEKLVQWALENYMNIENLPVDIVTGSDKAPVTSQVQAQPQEPIQDIDTATQAQAQVQVQTQVQPTQVQATVQATPQANAQSVADQIPAQEI